MKIGLVMVIPWIGARESGKPGAAAAAGEAPQRQS
jgi:hypothetical protein